MIKTTKVKEPTFFKSAKFKDLKNILTSHFSKPIAQRSQSKFPIQDLQIKLDEVKVELLKKTNYKCAYCESKIDSLEATIDHFRPHYAAANTSGKISQEHYWWLALKWNNLLPSCSECNTNKRNYFPIYKKRATVNYYAKDTLFNIEAPIFIDPEFENPEEYFKYLETGEILPLTERAKITIELLNLNRQQLVRKRREIVHETNAFLSEINSSESTDKSKDRFNHIISLLENSFEDDDKPYLGLRRFLVRKFINELNYPLKNISDISFKRKLKLIDRSEASWDSDPDFDPGSRFQIDNILIFNYRSINKLNINFKRTKSKKAGWAILIGENGVGKSSALSATLKTLIGRNYNGLRFNKNEVNRNYEEEDARIIISFEDSLMAEASISKNTRANYLLPKDYFINSTIIAFSPFKHSSKSDDYNSRFKGGCFVDNFIKPSVPLHNALKFILALTPEQFEFVAIALLDLMMLDGKARIHRKLHKDEVWFQYNDSGRKEFFDQLSDGYQSVITLGCNIIEGLLFNNESIENASGFVVIDEIGANLHPRWKMQIVKRLRRTFPNVQFLVTTHDPLCLKGIEENETYVLKSNNGELEVLTDLPNPSEYRADQLLTSEFFGLFSTVDPEMEEEFKEYYELLYKDKDTLKISEKRRLNDLKKSLRDKNHLGDTFREELLYIAIDEILAKQKKSEEPFSRKVVEKEVKDKAIELIDDFLNDLEDE
ncbi:retron system putative HNH endonuclease [Olleya sp. 1-3]|uniref:retron system putative HNH endonuclease n=1 Tax=Olleya sp. 1-3 TaxID=2058323 RepID=UPI000C33D15C|nr:retron system putative HNH endonuclease [Olleya sp. 1-3]PKG52340.1 TIGR02646 family protein [Olleya sp. 1-3]